MGPVAQPGSSSKMFTPNPALVGDRQMAFLLGKPVAKRTRSLPDGNTPTELIMAQMEEQRMHVGETQLLKGKCVELHQIAQHQQQRQSEMEGTANNLVKALGHVLKEVSLQTKRHDALLTIHHEALINVEENQRLLMTRRGKSRWQPWKWPGVNNKL